MKHTQGELLDIIYRYYPRGVGIVDGDIDIQLIYNSEEHARLVAAQQKAVTDERWHAMQRRIDEHFPDATLVNYSRHLPGGQDACYSFLILPPEITRQEQLWFHVSFLAPYYILSGYTKGYCVVSIDGILRREDGSGILAQIRRLIESPVAPCGIAAKGKIEAAARALEELLAAWDGNGAPSDAMVAWASSFLASWDGDENGGLRED